MVPELRQELIGGADESDKGTRVTHLRVPGVEERQIAVARDAAYESPDGGCGRLEGETVVMLQNIDPG
jgi:hypothetical protein